MHGGWGRKAAKAVRLPGGLQAALGPPRPRPARARPPACQSHHRPPHTHTSAQHGARVLPEPARSRPRRRSVPSARGRVWRRPAARGQFRAGPLAFRPRQPLLQRLKRKGSYLQAVPAAAAAASRGRPRGSGAAAAVVVAAATAVPSAPLFPFQEAPGKAEPGNQEVPRRDTSCRRRYGNGPRLPQGGSPGTPPPRRRPRPPHRPPTVAAAAAAAAILARAGSPCLPGGTCAAPALPSGALTLGCRRRPTAQAPLQEEGLRGPGSARRLLQNYAWAWTNAASDTWGRATALGAFCSWGPSACRP